MATTQKQQTQGWQEADHIPMDPGQYTVENLVCRQCQGGLSEIESAIDSTQYEGYAATGRTLLRCDLCQRYYYVKWHSVYSVGQFYL